VAKPAALQMLSNTRKTWSCAQVQFEGGDSVRADQKSCRLSAKKRTDNLHRGRQGRTDNLHRGPVQAQFRCEKKNANISLTTRLRKKNQKKDKNFNNKIFDRQMQGRKSDAQGSFQRILDKILPHPAKATLAGHYMY
jgi:hypothetical protein